MCLPVHPGGILKNLFVPVYRLTRICDPIAIAVERTKITKPRQVVEALEAFYRGAYNEVLVAVLLDTAGRMIGIMPVKQGNHRCIDVTPREVFQIVLSDHNAAAFILSHNHGSSGDPQPGDDDLNFMQLIKKHGDNLDCPLKDFIVLGDGGNYWSARNEGYYL